MDKNNELYNYVRANVPEPILQAFEKMSSCTKGHSLRVALYSQEIARLMGFSEKTQKSVFCIALFHDIGKISIPNSILSKPSMLTPEERTIIQTHPIKGGEILAAFDANKDTVDGALYHHEHYNGKGYCKGLAEEQIPMIARIICVADSYDAMSSDRCYRRALPKEKILAEVEAGSGTQFDPQIAAIMANMIREDVVPIILSGQSPQH